LGTLQKKLVRVKIANPHGQRLGQWRHRGAVLRTFVALLETIRTQLMGGNSGADTMTDVFQWIMRIDGWTGLLCGNTVNVLRVAPSKAIEAR
jgi:solute carrier family 25 (mitochondrial phosphate transporter), member 23/24/25/41